MNIQREQTVVYIVRGIVLRIRAEQKALSRGYLHRFAAADYGALAAEHRPQVIIGKTRRIPAPVRRAIRYAAGIYSDIKFMKCFFHSILRKKFLMS